MPADTEFLTPPEAAVVASVTVRDINRVIDEKILPERFYTLEGGRRLHVVACPLIGFYFRAAKALTSEERGLLIRRLAERIGPAMARRPIARWRKTSRPADWSVHDGFLTVSLWEFAINAEDRHAKLAEAREMVVEDPDILDRRRSFGARAFRSSTLQPLLPPACRTSVSGLPFPGSTTARSSWPRSTARRHRRAVGPVVPPCLRRMRGSCRNARWRGAGLHEAANRRMPERGTHKDCEGTRSFRELACALDRQGCRQGLGAAPRHLRRRLDFVTKNSGDFRGPADTPGSR